LSISVYFIYYQSNLSVQKVNQQQPKLMMIKTNT